MSDETTTTETPQPQPNQHVMVANFKNGDKIDGLYFIESVQLKTAKTGKPYTDVTIRDKSGSMVCKMWQDCSQMPGQQFGVVLGKVESYNGVLSPIVDTVELVAQPDDLGDFMAVVDGRDDLIQTFHNCISKALRIDSDVGGTVCGKVLTTIWKADQFLAKFFYLPYGHEGGYNLSGGLLLHTVRTYNIFDYMGQVHGLSGTVQKNKQALVGLTAAIIHEMGGVDLYEFRSCMPVTLPRHSLLGPAASAALKLHPIVQRAMCGIDDETADRLLHCCMACTGGAAPCTIEATLLSMACRNDYVVAAVQKFLETSKPDIDGMTGPAPVTQRRYFVGKQTPETK